MKKHFTLGLLMITIFSFGQEAVFKLTKDGFTDYVVIPFEGKSQSELYKKTLEWVSMTYKNPKEVILAQIENDYIRIEGFSENLFGANLGMGTGKTWLSMKYQVEIFFKDGKYKFDVIDMEQKYTTGWMKSEINCKGEPLDNIYKNNGDPKTYYKFASEDVPLYFNKLNISLKDYIIGNINAAKGDW